MTILEVRGLHKSYHDGSRELPILRGVQLQVEEGDFIGICGPSGCGKSTFLQCVAGLESFQAGEVKVCGHHLAEMTETELARLRNTRMGFVFQQFHLIPMLTALENVMLPLLIAGVGTAEARQSAMHLLKEVGLDARMTHRPSQLSGGEQQRVAIARALICKPSIVFADEPTGNLDQANGEAILRLLLQLRESHHMTLVLVTHNMDLMRSCGSRLELKNATLHPIP